MPHPNRTSTVLLGILTTIMVGWVLHAGASILQPLVIALLLASMLQPVVRWLARRHIPPPVTIILLVMLLFFGIARAGLVLQEAIREFVTDRPDTTSPSIQLPRLSFEDDPDDEATDEEQDGDEHESDDGSAQAGDVPSELPSEDREDAAAQHGDPAAGEPRGPPGEPGADVPGPTGSAGGSGAQSDPAPSADGALPPTGEQGEESGGDERASSLLGWGGIVDRIEIQLREREWDEDVVQYITRTLRDADLESGAIGLLGGGFDFTRNLLLVLIYMVFIFAEQAVFRRKILSIAGRRRQDAAQILDTIGRGIQRYLGVKTIVSLATGILCYSVLEALQIPYRLLFGFLTFFLNYIPTFGSIIAGIFPTLVALVVFDSPVNAIIVVITYLFVNIALGSFLEPRILGRELNLSPLVIIVSVVVWAGIWGVVGTFLAVPLTAAAQIILASQENTRPIAIMLSSGPPREARRRRRRARRNKVES